MQAEASTAAGPLTNATVVRARANSKSPSLFFIVSPFRSAPAERGWCAQNLACSIGADGGLSAPREAYLGRRKLTLGPGNVLWSKGSLFRAREGYWGTR